MRKNRVTFIVFNETDNVFASPGQFKTRQEAAAFARQFRERFTAQGYYLTASRERIPVAEVRLVIEEAE